MKFAEFASHNPEKKEHPVVRLVRMGSFYLYDPHVTRFKRSNQVIIILPLLLLGFLLELKHHKNL